MAIHAIPFVATDLTTAVHPDLAEDCPDMRDGQRLFRRLSPAYYAWLRSRMTVAQRKQAQGLLPEANYQVLRARFNAVHDLAIAAFGEDALLAAVATTDPVCYRPPAADTAIDLAEAPRVVRDHLVFARGRTVQGRGWRGLIVEFHPADADFPCGWVDVRTDDGRTGQADARSVCDVHGQRLVTVPTFTPMESRAIAAAQAEQPADFDGLADTLPIFGIEVPGAWRFHQQPSVDAFLLVTTIRDQAHALGWTDADLFQTCGRYAFPCGQDYGLVCAVRGHTLGAITAESITLVPETPGGAPLRFPRPSRMRGEA